MQECGLQLRPAPGRGACCSHAAGCSGLFAQDIFPQLSRPSVASSAAQVNWDRRVAALARCAGLVAGGAAKFNALPDLLRRLMRDALSLQIADRWRGLNSLSKPIP